MMTGNAVHTCVRLRGTCINFAKATTVSRVLGAFPKDTIAGQVLVMLFRYLNWQC